MLAAGSGALARRRPQRPPTLSALRTQHSALLVDYLDFLEGMGAGEVGSASFMIFDGLVHPSEVHGQPSNVASSRNLASSVF